MQNINQCSGVGGSDLEPQLVHCHLRCCMVGNLYINLRRSCDVADGRTDGVPSSIRLSVGFIQFALDSFYADCPHKRIT